MIFDEMGKLSAAEGFYKKAVETDDNLANAWNNWGVTAFIKNDFKTAQVRFEKAVSIDPENASGWFNLRDTYLELKQPDLADKAQKELDRIDQATSHDED